jgi:Zn-dependent protease
MLENMGDVEGEPHRVLLRHGERYFRVGIPMWTVLDALQNGETRHSIGERLVVLYPYPGSAAQKIEHPALRSADRLLEMLESARSPGRVIRGRVEFDVTWLVDPIAVWLKPLLRAPVVFQLVFGVVLVANIAAYWALPPIQSMHPARDALVIAAAMFFIISFHELGHASVATVLGCKAHRVGLGLYFFLPVFYADVSEIWRLRPHRRVLVNIAGVYVQLALGIVLFMIGRADVAIGGLARALFVVNLLSVCANLLPFGKLDGYWIVADLLNVSDLQARAWERIGRLFGRGAAASASRNETAVLVYALGLVAFILLVLGRVGFWLVDFVAALMGGFGNALSSTLQSPASWIVIAYLTVRLCRALVLILKAATRKGASA